MTTPSKIGRYEVIRELGAGAMGGVVQARDPLMDRTVAIKTILAAALIGPQAKEYRDRFLREARAAGRLAHPGLVTVFDVGEHEGMPFLVMEFIAGRTLEGALDAGERYSQEQIYSFGQQLAEALDYAHKNGVVHRDIKPANVMLTAGPGQPPDSVAKITDFGVAKLTASQVTATGQLLGTPSFMPPEQFTGQPIDGRSDLFSLGVILYTLATGDKPFPGDTITAVSYKVVHTDPIPPRKLNPSVSAEFNAVIMKCLEKDPATRYQSGEALARDLRALHEGRPVSAPSLASGTVMAPSTVSDTAATMPLDAPGPGGAKSPPGERIPSGAEGQTVPLLKSNPPAGMRPPATPAPRSAVAMPPPRPAPASAPRSARPAPAASKLRPTLWIAAVVVIVSLLAAVARRNWAPQAIAPTPSNPPAAGLPHEQQGAHPEGAGANAAIPAPVKPAAPAGQPQAGEKNAAEKTGDVSSDVIRAKADQALKEANAARAEEKRVRASAAQRRAPLEIAVNHLPHSADLIIWSDDRILYQREGRREAGGAPLNAESSLPPGHHVLRVVIGISALREEVEQTVEGEFTAGESRVLRVRLQRNEKSGANQQGEDRPRNLRKRPGEPFSRLHVALE